MAEIHSDEEGRDHHRAFGEPATADGYEPDPAPEPEYPEDGLPPVEEGEDDLVPADWVEGHDDNSASERGSHWEDE